MIDLNDRKIIFSGRLRELRTEKSLSQYQLADALGVSRGLIGNYELANREPDFNTLVLIADYFCVSVDYILGISDVRHRLFEDDIKPDVRVITDYMNLSRESKTEVRKYIDLLKLKEERN